MFLKCKVLLPKLLLGLVLGFIGVACLVLSSSPSLLLSWIWHLQEYGQQTTMGLGVVFTVGGLFTMLSVLKQFASSHLLCRKSQLVCSIHNGLFEQTVQKLWHEYFHRSDLDIKTNVIGHRMYVSGEIPQEKNSPEELLSYLSHNLLILTGYWGEICLTTTIVP